MSVKELNTLKIFIHKCPKGPGVYKMIGSKKEVLYIGKAKNLKTRLKYYQNVNNLSKRAVVMLSKLKKVEIVQVESEVKALLLEASLIQKYKPRYNILLKDNKSFPYICLGDSKDFPRVFLHRGCLKSDGDYYGPFISSRTVKQIIGTIQNLFCIRTCTNSFFASRKKPCILYQMKRCSAPCVGKINESEYKKDIRKARIFLRGNTKR